MFELIYALWRRDMVKFLRDRRTVLASLARPLLWLLAFGFGLRGSVRLGPGNPDFVSFLVPGLATMTVLFSSTFAAISIVWDREFGFLKELLVSPASRSTIVAGKMLAGSTSALIEACLMLAVSPLVGARFSPSGALAALPLLALFGMAVNALGIVIAARLKSFEGFGGVVNFLIQPVFFLSGALYPVNNLPRALRAIVTVNPMTYAVDAIRGLMIGRHAFPLPLDLGILALATVVLGAWAVRAFQAMDA